MDPSPSLAKVIQIAVVVPDLRAAMERYLHGFGIGPWSIYHADGVEQTIRGRPATVTFRYALSDTMPIQLELVEPMDQVSIYAEFLKDHGPGLHHLAYETPVDDPIVRSPTGEPWPVLCAGIAKGVDGSVLDYFYFDTRADLGYFVETYRIPRTWERPAPDDIYPRFGS